MTYYLPAHIVEQIDVNTLEPQKDSFITQDLKEVFSDLLFKVNIHDE
ncbi:Putative transposase, YhgA-like, partial [Halolactibacillus miurensis]